LRRIFATEFGIWPVGTNIAALSDSMLSSKLHWATLANYLLLYDQIVIPTGNFQILPVLRLMLGDDIFNELISTNVIVLARHDKWFAYGGNGSGLCYFSLEKGPSNNLAPSLAHGYFQPLDEALDIAITSTLPQTNSQNKSILTNLLLDKTIITPLEELGGSLFEESYNDVLGSPYLRDVMLLKNAGRSLNKLKGIKSNSITFFNPQLPNDDSIGLEIRAVLRVAFENLMLSLGTYVKATEIASNEGTLAIVSAKGQRAGATLSGENAFTKIQEISGVPDLGQAFAGNKISPKEIVKLRESKHCIALRDWMANQSSLLDSDDIVQEYVSSIGKQSLLESIPAKLLRFATATGIGAINPVAGSLASFTDSFLLSKWSRTESPRLFMKEAKQLFEEKAVEKSIPTPIMRGRDRNKPCYCGSKKKYKKCHGKTV